jgi:hypothetical protein
MPKTFLDFTKTGYLSAANFIGYQGNQEFSISLDSLAAAVYSYIERSKIQTPILYRFDPVSTITIPNLNNFNKTYGIYLSSSVQDLDLTLGSELITLTQAGSCYDLTTASLVLSTDKSTLCPGDWITINNTALSSITTVFFEQTGSAVVTVEDRPTPCGLGENGLMVCFRNIGLNILIRTTNWAANSLLEQADDVFDIIIPSVGSGLSGQESDDCKQFRAKMEKLRDDLHSAHNDLYNHNGFEDWITKFTKFHDLHTDLLQESLEIEENPCGGVATSEMFGSDQELLDAFRATLNERDRLTRGD